MATLYGSNATKGAGIATRIPQGEVGGKVRIAYDEYVAAATIGATDTIRMCKLPAGARVVDVVLSHPDMGTTGSCTVGWEANGVDSADADGFLTSVDLNAAANTVSIKDEANVPGMFVKFGAETQVTIAMSAATTATSGTIKLAVWYVIE